MHWLRDPLVQQQQQQQQQNFINKQIKLQKYRKWPIVGIPLKK